MDLTNPKEIQKCLHGETRNQNEPYNSIIWERVPKITYCGKYKLELAVYDAAVNFNDGRQGTIEIFKKLNITPGHYTTVLCYMLNKRRIYTAKYTEKKSEGKTYKCGGF